MTTYIVTTFDGDPDDGTSVVRDSFHTDDEIARFFENPHLKDGMGIMIRRADYLADDPSRQGYEAAVAYIDAATTKEERRRRKTEVFHIIYGNDSARRQVVRAGGDVYTAGRDMHVSHLGVQYGDNTVQINDFRRR